jgi:hypothetical protein
VKPIAVLARGRYLRAGPPAVWNGIADPYGLFRQPRFPLYDAGGRRASGGSNPDATEPAAGRLRMPGHGGIYLSGPEGN